MVTHSSRRRTVLPLVALLAASPLPAQTTTIRTYATPVGGGVGLSVNIPTGLPHRGVGVGQTFVTPGGSPSALQDFSFWFFHGETSGAPGVQGGVPFVAQLYAWDGSPPFGPVGPALFTSPVAVSPPLTGPLSWDAYTFPTGALLLRPHTAYLALVSILGVPNDGQQRLFTLNTGNGDPYPPGRRVDATQFLATGEIVWTPRRDDFMFEARLVATPEPATLGLAAAGLVAVAGVRGARRRR